MRLIDADALESMVFEVCNKRNMTMTTETVIDAIRYMPTIDAVEVARCKDCKHRYEEGDNTHYYWCRLHDRPVDDTDYCAWAEESEVEE